MLGAKIEIDRRYESGDLAERKPEWNACYSVQRVLEASKVWSWVESHEQNRTRSRSRG